MNSSHLTADQLAKMQVRFGETRSYYRRVLDKMIARGFPFDDALRQMVTKLTDAAHDAGVRSHYLACDRGAKRATLEDVPICMGYWVQVVINEGHPIQDLEYWTYVEAETPLEAIAKLAREGTLGNSASFFVRVATSTENGRPRTILTIPMTSEMIRPTKTER